MSDDPNAQETNQQRLEEQRRLVESARSKLTHEEYNALMKKFLGAHHCDLLEY